MTDSLAAERQHRLDSFQLKKLLEEFARPEFQAEVPGKTTLAEHAERIDQLAVILSRHRVTRLPVRPSVRGGTWQPGQRALVAEMVAAAPKLTFSDCRAMGLRDVLSRLNSHPQLQQETLSAAAPRVARRVARPKRDANATPAGQAMCNVANQRAVTLYRRATAVGIGAPETKPVTRAIDDIGTGIPLPLDVRLKLEAALHVSLENVRLHTGPVARDAAAAVCAEAFTVCEDIFYPGYDPTSYRCQETLAHEVVHCVQWQQGRIGVTAGGPTVSRPDDPFEREAEQAARSIVTTAFRTPAEPAGAGANRGRAEDAPRLAEPAATGPAPLLAIGPRAPGGLLVMRRPKNDAGDRPPPEVEQLLEEGSWNPAWYQTPIGDVIRSSLWVPQYVVEEVAGEYGALITKSLRAIAAGIAALLPVIGQATITLELLLTNPFIAAFIMLGATAFAITVTAKDMAAAAGHCKRWLELAWRANGNTKQLDEASREFMRMLVTLLMAYYAGKGTVQSAWKPGKLFRSSPESAGAGRAGRAGIADGKTLEAKLNPDGSYSIPGAWSPTSPVSKAEIVPPTAETARAGTIPTYIISKNGKPIRVIEKQGKFYDPQGNIVNPNKVVPAMAGGTFDAPRESPQSTMDGSSATSPVSGNAPNAQDQVDADFNTAVAYVKENCDSATAKLFENYMTTSVYGPYTIMQEAEGLTDASPLFDELETMKRYLQPRVGEKSILEKLGLRKVNTTGLGPELTEQTKGKRHSLEIAKEAYGRVRELQERHKSIPMSLGDYLLASHLFNFSFGHEKSSFLVDGFFKGLGTKPLTKPFSLLIERFKSLPIRDINNAFTANIGLAERIPPGTRKNVEGYSSSHVSVVTHDLNHYTYSSSISPRGTTAGNKPVQAPDALRQISINIQFYRGFQQLRDQRSPREQQIWDIVWFDITRERNDMDPQRMAIWLDRSELASTEIFEGFARKNSGGGIISDDPKYSLDEDQSPVSKQEIDNVVISIRNYVEKWAEAGPGIDKKQMAFSKEFRRLFIMSSGRDTGDYTSWSTGLLYFMAEKFERRLHPVNLPFTPQEFAEGYRAYRAEEDAAKWRTEKNWQSQEKDFEELIRRYTSPES